MEKKIYIKLFAEWLHSCFVPGKKPGTWMRKEKSQTLESSELQDFFILENPEYSKLWGKAGLLVLAAAFYFTTGIVEPVKAFANAKPVMIIDSTRYDSIMPVAWLAIRIKEYPLKSKKQ